MQINFLDIFNIADFLFKFFLYGEELKFWLSQIFSWEYV